MGIRAIYEWDVEQFDPETGDIIDHSFSDDCPGVPTEEGYRLVLVRERWWFDRGEAVDQLDGKGWAYVEGGQLPEHFDNGERVPVRFHKELVVAELSKV